MEAGGVCLLPFLVDRIICSPREKKYFIYNRCFGESKKFENEMRKIAFMLEPKKYEHPAMRI